MVAVVFFSIARELDLPLIGIPKLILTLLLVAVAVYAYLKRTEHIFLTAGFAAALFFSAIGDVLLELPEQYFLPGLSSFLTAHIIYAVILFMHTRKLHITATVVVLVYAVLVNVFLLQPNMEAEPGLAVPVIMYSAVIGIMVISAFGALKCDKVTGEQKVLLISAALLFFISDTILAVDKFVTRLAFNNILILLPYFTSQLLFTLSLFPRKKPKA